MNGLHGGPVYWLATQPIRPPSDRISVELGQPARATFVVWCMFLWWEHRGGSPPWFYSFNVRHDN